MYQLLTRSDNWITPKCSLLNFTTKTEAICENEETQARLMYSDANVVQRISDCSTYFSKFPNVAYKKVNTTNTHFLNNVLQIRSAAAIILLPAGSNFL